MTGFILYTDDHFFDHVRYAREWSIDWDWYEEMQRDWEEEHKPDPTVADLLGIWDD